MASSSDYSPCPICKFLGWKCMKEECVFAPYFPPEKFAPYLPPGQRKDTDSVFKAMNKILDELTQEQREKAVNSQACELDATRLDDPHYRACLLAILDCKIRIMDNDLTRIGMKLQKYTSVPSMIPSQNRHQPYRPFNHRLGYQHPFSRLVNYALVMPPAFEAKAKGAMRLQQDLQPLLLQVGARAGTLVISRRRFEDMHRLKRLDREEALKQQQNRV